MADQKALTDLRKCMKQANGDPAAMAACEKAFTDLGGAVTPVQGKVFSTPDGSAAFVTKDGKAFCACGPGLYP
jgi:hypothetical protein